MKKNLLYLFALICSVSLLVACNDDDPEYIQDGEFDGVYLGTLDVDAAGVIKVDDIPQKVYITKTGENQFKMELKNFSFQTMELGNISVDNIAVIKKGNSCTFSGKANLTLAVGACDVTVSGTIEDNKLDMDIAVVAAGTLNVAVDFEGTKLAADKSSEAKILTFTFANEFVTSQPVIDSENKTITFVVSDQMPE
ncbi:calycin-like domain-containing protein [Bacteroides fragilis]|nr:calycin-like domain-containing protein [Bacteroides fragilis]MCB6717914.1 calycin-like domain-containing protein [Bacteroides fragilis]MCQ5171135.1 calycin-like domain-containing protein [Bacteroides fragilis]